MKYAERIGFVVLGTIVGAATMKSQFAEKIGTVVIKLLKNPDCWLKWLK